jgi:hypothetical protein
MDTPQAAYLANRASRVTITTRTDVPYGMAHPQRAMLLAHMPFEQADDDPAPSPKAVDAALRGDRRARADLARPLGRQASVLGALAAGHAELTGKSALAYTGHANGTQAGVCDAARSRDPDRTRPAEPVARRRPVPGTLAHPTTLTWLQVARVPARRWVRAAVSPRRCRSGRVRSRRSGHRSWPMGR